MTTLARGSVARVTLHVEHDDLVNRIAGNRPAAILGLADTHDLEQRALHLKQLLEDVEAYVAAVIKDTAYSSNVSIDVHVTGQLSDMRGDIIGALLNAVDELRGRVR